MRFKAVPKRLLSREERKRQSAMYAAPGFEADKQRLSGEKKKHRRHSRSGRRSQLRPQQRNMKGPCLEKALKGSPTV